MPSQSHFSKLFHTELVNGHFHSGWPKLLKVDHCNFTQLHLFLISKTKTVLPSPILCCTY